MRPELRDARKRLRLGYLAADAEARGQNDGTRGRNAGRWECFAAGLGEDAEDEDEHENE